MCKGDSSSAIYDHHVQGDFAKENNFFRYVLPCSKYRPETCIKAFQYPTSMCFSLLLSKLQPCLYQSTAISKLPLLSVDLPITGCQGICPLNHGTDMHVVQESGWNSFHQIATLQLSTYICNIDDSQIHCSDTFNQCLHCRTGNKATVTSQWRALVDPYHIRRDQDAAPLNHGSAP